MWRGSDATLLPAHRARRNSTPQRAVGKRVRINPLQFHDPSFCTVKLLNSKRQLAVRQKPEFEGEIGDTVRLARRHGEKK